MENWGVVLVELPVQNLDLDDALLFSLVVFIPSLLLAAKISFFINSELLGMSTPTLESFVVAPVPFNPKPSSPPSLPSAIAAAIAAPLSFYAGTDVTQFQYDLERWLVNLQVHRAAVLVYGHGTPGSGQFQDSTPFQRGRRDKVSFSPVAWTPELLWSGFRQSSSRPSNHDFSGIHQTLQAVLIRSPSHPLQQLDIVLAQTSGKLFANALLDLVSSSPPLLANEGERIVSVNVVTVAEPELAQWLVTAATDTLNAVPQAAESGDA